MSGVLQWFCLGCGLTEGAMDNQTLYNLLGSAILATLGWIARELWGAVKSLRQDLHQLEVDLPSKYIPRVEYHDDLKEIKDLCSKIFDKIDALEQRKVDK